LIFLLRQRRKRRAIFGRIGVGDTRGTSTLASRPVVDDWPIAWTINEIVLVHSMNGHAHLAKWQLLA